MSYWDEVREAADTLDSAPSDCACAHCRTLGRIDQDNTCRWSRKTAPEPLETINRAIRYIPKTR